MGTRRDRRGSRLCRRSVGQRCGETLRLRSIWRATTSDKLSDMHNTLGGLHVGWSAVQAGDTPRDGRSFTRSYRSLRMIAASSLFHIGGTMLRASTWVLLLGVSVSSLSACTTTKVQTFSAPSLAATKIESIAILPFQPTRVGPDMAVSLNRGIGQAFAARNPRMRMV